jgi:hypothetical protein
VYHHEEGQRIATAGSANSLERVPTQTEIFERHSDSTSDDGDSTSDSGEKLSRDLENEEKVGEEPEEEVDAGIRTERDVELGGPVEKKKSARSIKDPNLVSPDLICVSMDVG